METLFKVNAWGHTYEITRIEVHEYMFGNHLAIELYCKSDEGNWEEPYCTLSVNLPGFIKANEFYGDVNNVPMAVFEEMKRLGYIVQTDEFQNSGYVTYPLFKATNKLMALKEN